MKATFLGTGTSVGIPVIGCACPVCVSTDPRNKRRRTSLHLQAAELHVVVDTPPDFREQALQFKIPRIDAVLLTHSHADHIFGFDDIRRYNTMQDAIIPAYGSPETLDDMRRIFNYIHNQKVEGLYRPRTEFRPIDGPFDLGGIHVVPLAVIHDPKMTLGFLFECEGRTMAYIPDCHELPETVIDRLKGIDVMVLDALRHVPHKTHLTVEESAKLLLRIGARESYMIHLGHDLDHAETERNLPGGIRLAYDGLTLDW